MYAFIISVKYEMRVNTKNHRAEKRGGKICVFIEFWMGYTRTGMKKYFFYKSILPPQPIPVHVLTYKLLWRAKGKKREMFCIISAYGRLVVLSRAVVSVKNFHLNFESWLWLRLLLLDYFRICLLCSVIMLMDLVYLVLNFVYFARFPKSAQILNCRFFS